MASVVSICNLGLSMLGDEANITSIDPAEGSAQAEHCQRYYPIARDMVLEAHTWGIATRRKALVQLPDEDPPASWGFIYQRPVDCLRAVAVLAPGATDDNDGEEFIEETIEGDVRVIYSNMDEATLRYIVRVEDTTKYSMHMVNAIARLLASMVAGPIIKGEVGMKVAAALLQRYEKVELPAAKSLDSNAKKSNLYNDFTASGIAARA